MKNHMKFEKVTVVLSHYIKNAVFAVGAIAFALCIIRAGAVDNNYMSLHSFVLSTINLGLIIFACFVVYKFLNFVEEITTEQIKKHRSRKQKIEARRQILAQR